MSTSRVKRSLSLLPLLSTGVLLAQTATGINGTVTDSSGAVVVGSQVEAMNTATGVLNRTVTSSAGTYTFPNLLPGTYKVTVTGAGFDSSVNNGVVVSTDRIATVNATLATGEVNTTVQVQSPAISLQTESPQLGVTIENQVVEELPDQIGTQNRGRQIDDFLYLAPGVTGSASFSHRISGGEDFQNEVLFQGIPAVQSETQGLQDNINPPFEMVNEFHVATSVFSPQYGLGQGAVTYNFVSGTNRIHGDAFEIYRNSFFDARGLVQINPTVPTVRENNYGFTVGGPVWLGKLYDGRNRTFWHASSEWYENHALNSGTETVPTVLAKQGNFSEYASAASPNVIYVPQGVNCNGLQPGTPFPNNIIPANCISPLSASLLSQVPNPTLPGINRNINSQLGVLDTSQTSWGYTLDHTLSQRNSIHFSQWRDIYLTPLVDNGANFNTEISGLKYEPRVGSGFFLNLTSTVSPNLVVTAGIGWLGEINNEVNPHQGVNFPGVAQSSVFPTISFNPPSSAAPNPITNWGVGSNGEISSINRKLVVAVVNNYLYTHGRHTMNFGFETRRAFQDDHEQDNAGGGFSFSSVTTSNGNPNPTGINETNTGNAFASYLLGQVDSAARQQALETKLRNFTISPYITDDLKLTPQLTIDYGLRWDILVPFTADQPQNLIYLDLTKSDPGAVGPNGPLPGAAVQLAGSGAYGAGIDHANTSFKDVGPRFGFSYQANSKTVVSGGFALVFLDGGAFEFGTNKVALSYGNVLAGLVQVTSSGGPTPAYGDWDTKQLAAPQTTPFSPTVGNGNGLLHPFQLTGIHQPYTENYNLTIQRELPWNLYTAVSYVGNHGVHLPSALNPTNQLNPQYLALGGSALQATWNTPAGQAALAQAGIPVLNGLRQPYTTFGSDFPSGSVQQALLELPQYLPTEDGNTLNNFDTNGVSVYNALQAELQKRFTNGLSFLLSYTFARDMSNSDEGFSSFTPTTLNKFNQRAEWAVSSADQPQVTSLSGVYELPFGAGKPYLSGGGGFLSREVIGGWQVSGIFQYSSGTPFGISAAGSPLATGGNRANINPGVPLQLNWNNYYKGLPVLNVAAYSDPGQYGVGDAARNESRLRSPFSGNENVTLAKKFSFGEGVQGELRMEYFNILNRMQVGSSQLDMNVSDGSTFGSVLGPSQGNTPRQGQAYFRVSF